MPKKKTDFLAQVKRSPELTRSLERQNQAQQDSEGQQEGGIPRPELEPQTGRLIFPRRRRTWK